MSEVLPETPVSDSQAAEALFNAMQEDTGRTSYGEAGQGAQTPATPAPESKPEPATPEGDAQEGATEASTEAADSFTKLDPNAIPEELKPWYQSFQADYTRKTQQLAEVRKQYEALGDVDPNAVQIGLNLLQQLQDPQGALEFHSRLTDTLQSAGLTPAQAAAEATRQMQQSSVEAPAWEDDPEAAMKAELDTVKSQLNEFQQQLATREEATRREQYELALQGEIQRQESVIRDSNPHYTQDDMNAIYELAAFHEGNLLDSQGRYEDIVAARINRLMATKASAAADLGVQSVVAPSTSQELPSFGDDLEAAHRAAQERLMHVLAES